MARVAEHREAHEVTVVDEHPYAAYTEQADDFEVGYAELDEVLPPFTAGLLTAAGRLLAVLAYRDALSYGDRPFKRRSAKAKHRVLARLPTDCDGQDQVFRLQFSRCFADLASDVETGRAPLPRCTGERHALELMIDCAPELLACSDDEIRQLGITVPDAAEEYDYHGPFWESVCSEFIIEGAEYSIPEAQPAHDDHEDQDVPEPPREGWAAARFWFSPYGITTARDANRGYPSWVRASLDGGALPEPHPGGFDEADRLLRWTNRVNQWQAYTDDYRAYGEERVLAEVLTPLGARLLEATANELVSLGYEEVVAYGDRPFPREDADEPLQASFLALLPPVCDRQNTAWRLAMVRAVHDLADDLRAGRAPLPRCFPGRSSCCCTSCCASPGAPAARSQWLLGLGALQPSESAEHSSRGCCTRADNPPTTPAGNRISTPRRSSFETNDSPEAGGNIRTNRRGSPVPSATRTLNHV